MSMQENVIYNCIRLYGCVLTLGGLYACGAFEFVEMVFDLVFNF